MDISIFRRRQMSDLAAAPVIDQFRAVAFGECLNGRYERYDAICITVVGTRRFGSEVHV